MGKKTKIKINKGSEPEIEKEIPEEEQNAAEEVTEEAPEEQPIDVTEDIIGNLRDQLEEAKKKAQENLEGWQHERADFSNYKKRVERDQEVSKNKYKEDVLKKFLTVLDDLELAYAHRPEEDDAAAWAEGIELIIRKFKSLLENDGLTKIDVKAGDKLDPNIHMAVSLEDSEEFGSDEIIEVLQNGYRMGEKIVRPAMVRVAR
ncbi:MAG: nucleotide exchange factor GrpE [Anaerolineaceae bacterium]|nr:nucleotide exchange factor GrpE [Anaerolineaceae bacterium]